MLKLRIGIQNIMNTWIRLATIEDLDMIYEWANDPVTRANSFSSAPIPYETHVQWFERTLEREDVLFLIEMDGEEPVGQLRVAISEESSEGEISISTAPDKRGMGYGKKIISDGIKYIKDLGDGTCIKTLVAEVKKENTSSQKMFEGCGFICADAGDFFRYELTLYKQNFTEVASERSRRLYIRADMNPTIATGHIMRCLSIADAARSKGIPVAFICADDCAKELLNTRGYEIHILGTDWQDMESEVERLRDTLTTLSVSLDCERGTIGRTTLLIDSYSVTEKYLSDVRSLTRSFGNMRVAYLDDLNAFKYPVDDLIVYANYYKSWNLEKKYGLEEYADCCESHTDDLHTATPHTAGLHTAVTRLILGTNYVPLRQEFQNLPAKQINDSIQNILIMSGGSDQYHVIRDVLERLESVELQDRLVVKLLAICGSYNQDYDVMAERYQDNPNISVIRAVPNLIDYIKEADLVISAGGTTLYEICACGTPAITYSFADNQLSNVREFEEDGLMEYAGDAREVGFLDNIQRFIEEYKDRTLRSTKSQKMQALVDGHGAERIVEALIKS